MIQEQLDFRRDLINIAGPCVLLLSSASSIYLWNSLEILQLGHLKVRPSGLIFPNSLADVSIGYLYETYELKYEGQTMEGGISSRPDAEAHGGYTFCALGALCIMGEPHLFIPKWVLQDPS